MKQKSFPFNLNEAFKATRMQNIDFSLEIMGKPLTNANVFDTCAAKLNDFSIKAIMTVQVRWCLQTY